MSANIHASSVSEKETINTLSLCLKKNDTLPKRLPYDVLREVYSFLFVTKDQCQKFTSLLLLHTNKIPDPIISELSEEETPPNTLEELRVSIKNNNKKSIAAVRKLITAMLIENKAPREISPHHPVELKGDFYDYHDKPERNLIGNIEMFFQIKDCYYYIQSKNIAETKSISYKYGRFPLQMFPTKTYGYNHFDYLSPSTGRLRVTIFEILKQDTQERTSDEIYQLIYKALDEKLSAAKTEETTYINWDRGGELRIYNPGNKNTQFLIKIRGLHRLRDLPLYESRVREVLVEAADHPNVFCTVSVEGVDNNTPREEEEEEDTKMLTHRFTHEDQAAEWCIEMQENIYILEPLNWYDKIIVIDSI